MMPLLVGESTHKKHGAVNMHHRWIQAAPPPLEHRDSGGLGPKKSLLDYCASDHFSRAHRKDIMKIKIRKDLQKRFKQWCKKNDMEPERAANNILNNEIEEFFNIIDGDDQAPSDKPQA